MMERLYKILATLKKEFPRLGKKMWIDPEELNIKTDDKMLDSQEKEKLENLEYVKNVKYVPAIGCWCIYIK